MDNSINYNGKVDNVAGICNVGDFTVFSSGSMSIRFRTSPYLERYTSILKWDNGYIECMAKYSTRNEPVEEYIDLNYIAERLRLPDNIFDNINKVMII